MSQLTKKAIMESFTRLLNEKPFDKITVKEIVDDCGINRNTFYYHFEGITELVVEILHMEIEKIYEEHRENVSWQDAFIEAAQFALQNKRAVYHIYNSVNRAELEHYINRIASEVMRQFVEKEAKELAARPEDVKLITHFYKSALVGMTLDWLEGGMKDDQEQMIRRLGVLLDGNIGESLKRGSEKNETRDKSDRL